MQASWGSAVALVIVTGLPATGKSTLAVRLAVALGLPLIAKDTLKEALFDVLGTGDAGWSRRLSDASYAAMFAIAAVNLRAGRSVLLEGNFRAGEHEAPILGCGARSIGQVLCAVPEPQRAARLARRTRERARHAGHLDHEAAATNPAAAAAAGGARFLDLPGLRLDYDGARAARGALDEVLRALEALRTASR
jgi:predicted kinase